MKFRYRAIIFIIIAMLPLLIGIALSWNEPYINRIDPIRPEYCIREYKVTFGYFAYLQIPWMLLVAFFSGSILGMNEEKNIDV